VNERGKKSLGNSNDLVTHYQDLESELADTSCIARWKICESPI